MSKFWTDERKALLRDKWLTHSARDLMEDLGLTSRSAVIAMTNRMGLPRKPMSGEPDFVLSERSRERLRTSQRKRWACEDARAAYTAAMKERAKDVQEYNARCRTESKGAK